MKTTSVSLQGREDNKMIAEFVQHVRGLKPGEWGDYELIGQVVVPDDGTPWVEFGKMTRDQARRMANIMMEPQP